MSNELTLASKCPLPEVGSPDWPWEDGYKESCMQGGYWIRQTGWKEQYLIPNYHEIDEIEEGEWICTHERSDYEITRKRLNEAGYELRTYENKCHALKQNLEKAKSAAKKAAKKAGLKFGKQEEAAFYAQNPISLPNHPYPLEEGKQPYPSYEYVRELEKNNRLGKWDWLKHYTNEWDERSSEEIAATSEDDNFDYVISMLKAECEQHAREQWFKKFLAQMNGRVDP